MHHIHRCSLHKMKPTQGGVLVTTLLIIAVISMLTASVLYRVTSRHATTYQSVSWNEALSSAEAGADFGLQALNKSIASPSTAWTGWTPPDATTFPKTYPMSPPAHAGEGNTKVFAKITVDNSITDGSGAKWYRLRSTGIAELPRRAVNGLEASVLNTSGVKNHRSALRKPRFYTDGTGGVLSLPQIARTIEVMAPPVGSALYVRAITTQNEIKLAAPPFYVDSFDSSNASKSTNGEWDLAKRQSNGDVASNSAGGISTLLNANVYGDASSNTGVIAGTTNLHGTLYNNFSTTIPPVVKPVWSTMNVNPVAITNPAAPVTLVGGPSGSPQNYKLTNLTISSAVNKLILDTHAAGQESYINIWVTGATTINGTGIIQQNPNVQVQIYSEGSILLGGGGWVNQTKRAENLLAYGVEPAVYSTRDFRVTAGQFIGVFNGGKTFDITLSGSASYIGAAIGRETDMTGCTGYFHYDENLSNLTANGQPTSYQVASWVEDIR